MEETSNEKSSVIPRQLDDLDDLLKEITNSKLSLRLNSINQKMVRELENKKVLSLMHVEKHIENDENIDTSLSLEKHNASMYKDNNSNIDTSFSLEEELNTFIDKENLSKKNIETSSLEISESSFPIDKRDIDRPLTLEELESSNVKENKSEKQKKNIYLHEMLVFILMLVKFCFIILIVLFLMHFVYHMTISSIQEETIIICTKQEINRKGASHCYMLQT
jgi:tRNA(Met) C34 N-acetyltransferase TmcA